MRNQLQRRVIQLFLDLAQVPDDASDAAVDKIARGLVALIVAAKVIPVTPPTLLKQWKAERMRAEILELLENVATRQPTTVRFTSLEVTVPAWTARRESAVTATGEARDVLLYALLRALETMRAPNIRVCKDPDCERLFLKVTKKAYCSATCQRRLYMRRWRRRQLNETRGAKHGKTTRPR
jgi:hypothetical protein